MEYNHGKAEEVFLLNGNLEAFQNCEKASALVATFWSPKPPALASGEILKKELL